MAFLSLAAAERKRGVGRNFSVAKRPYVYVHVKWKDVTAGNSFVAPAEVGAAVG
jgi:hypothetical protein